MFYLCFENVAKICELLTKNMSKKGAQNDVKSHIFDRGNPLPPAAIRPIARRATLVVPKCWAPSPVG